MFKLRCFCMSDIFNFVFPSFQMLRVQRVCGKSRSGASVPLCIKLQGEVVCGRPQHLWDNNGTGCTCPTESLERSDSQDTQPHSPLTSSVCESGGSNPEHCDQPHGARHSSGKMMFLHQTRLECYAQSKKDLKTMNVILEKLVHNLYSVLCKYINIIWYISFILLY